VLFVALATAYCGGSSAAPSPMGNTNAVPGVGAGPLVFRASPIAQSEIRWITPLGNLNPPDHTIPTDHIYFYFAAPNLGEQPLARRTSFYAPADGVVTTVLGGVGVETKIFVRATTTMQYYLDHLILEVPLAFGTTITAGQRLGTSGTAYGIDLGVINDSLTLSFVNPARYISDTLHADAPLKYFAEPLRSQLYTRVQRTSPDLDGKIDYDVAGRLAGNWFGETLSAAQLVFVYDTYDPSQVRIAFANAFVTGGVFAIAPGDPQPRDVSTGSGAVLYTLTRSITGPPVAGTPSGTLRVQMLNDQRIQAELFPLGASADAFTSAARIFIR
jgi:hypothetical protein